MISPPTLQLSQGIADLQAEIAYLAGPEDRIIALDLARGDIVARSDLAATPLAADDDQVIAWAPDSGGSPALRVIAAQRRGVAIATLWERRLELPNWVDLNTSEADAFSIEGAFEDTMVVVSWAARARYGGGAPPPSDVEDAAHHDGRGTVRLDRETGVPTGPEERTEGEEALTELPSSRAPDRPVVPYRSGPAWATSSWSTGAGESSLVRPTQGPGVVLHRRKAGEDQETQLSSDPDAEAAVTPDGQIVLIYEPGGGPHPWQVFSAKSAERLASLPFDPGTEWVAAIDDRILYQVVEDIGTTRRQSMHCRNLQTGELLWSQIFRETALKAPPPPMR